MDSKQESGLVSNIFGRAKYFALYDTESKELTFMDNPGASQPRGAGVAAVQAVADKGAKKVIAGHVGPNAAQALESNGIEFSPVGDKTLKQVTDTL